MVAVRAATAYVGNLVAHNGHSQTSIAQSLTVGPFWIDKHTRLRDGTLVNLVTVRDPYGEACLGAFLFPAGRVGQTPRRPNLAEVRLALRQCFAQWSTLPDEVQTDGEPVLAGQPQDSFPSIFRLWLKGLAIEHRLIRPGQPTDNAEVERCHRTLMEYAIIGNEHRSQLELAQVLQEAVHELASELPSWAAGCGGRPPLMAHPELLQPRRPFKREQEWALFDLRRVDDYLDSLTWQRKVSNMGQIEIGGQHRYYTVGRAYARRMVQVRYDPRDRHFVFYDPDHLDEEIGRRPAKGLELADLLGVAESPPSMVPQQLPLPLFDMTGVSC